MPKKKEKKPRAWFAPTSDPVPGKMPKRPKKLWSKEFVVDLRNERKCHYAPRKLPLDPNKRGFVFQLWNRDRVEPRDRWSWWLKFD